jgi:hypothetical protein
MLVHELQGFPIFLVLEEALSTTQYYRMNHEPELVDEVASKQRTEKSAAAEDRDILSRLPFEPGDLLRDVTPDQG